jgi:hypothetical protein
VSVFVPEPSEHSPDGVGLGGNFDPFHGSAATTAGADVDLPHVSQQPSPGPSLARAVSSAAVVLLVEPESELVRVAAEWILDGRCGLGHNFSAQR